MKAGHFTGVLLLIVLALLLSMAFVATPVLAPAVISQPGGGIIEVEGGQEFVLRFRLRWDRPGDLGYFSLAVTWDSPGESGTPSENFTFLGAEAYFDLDGDNLPDDPGSYITVDEAFYLGVVAGNARYTVVVTHTIGDERNGEFNVDLKFSAAGIGGVPHIPTASHPMSIVGTIDVFEGEVTYSYSPPVPTITVRVLGRGVAVSISPSYQSGLPEATLSYSVTVTNMGAFDDTFAFEVASDADWSVSIEPTSLTLTAGAMGEAALSVVMPPDAGENASMTVVVKATSTGDPTVSSSSACEVVASEETPAAPTPTAWPAALAVLIVVAILAGGYALYSIFKAGQRKRKGKRVFRA